jgi:ABC-2 type transport system ATP-binding protein
MGQQAGNAIEVRRLTKVYRGKRGRPDVLALDEVSFHVGWGEFVALVGENGAGKTTAIKILCTLVLPDGGEASVAGYDVVKHGDVVRSKIGWMHGETGGRALYWRLNAWDNLRFFAYLQNIPRDEASRRIRALVSYFDLEEYAGKLVKDYSTGMKVRLMLARTFLSNPEVLLLDEPTIGLDTSAAYETRRLLKLVNEELGRPILFTSHNMFEVEKLCRRLILIHRGRVIADGPPSRLTAELSKADAVELKVASTPDALEVLVEEGLVRELLKTEFDGEASTVTASVRDLREAFSAIPSFLVARGFRLISMKIAEPSLEEAFIRLTRE